MNFRHSSDRCYRDFKSSSIAVVTNSQGKCSGKINNFALVGTATKDYKDAKDMISEILTDFRKVNVTQFSEMMSLHVMFVLLSDHSSEAEHKRLVFIKLSKFNFRFLVIYQVY